MSLTVGVFGSGQLGLMLAEAARPLGINCVFLDNNTKGPASLAGKVFAESEFDTFCAALDVATLEFENTPPDLAAKLEAKGVLFPGVKALTTAQDRLREKQTFNELGIKTTNYRAVTSKESLLEAAEQIGLPMVVKTATGGYDGKGQYVVKQTQDLDQAWSELGAHQPLIAEGFIDFSREVSLIGVRGQDSSFDCYPLVENHHFNGILSHTHAPAPNQDAVFALAKEQMKLLMDHLDYVGVLTLELFETSEGLVANEIAPRVHNSGHFSIEGAYCSQFENHMRAVAGLPLGSTKLRGQSLMINVLSEHPSTAAVAAVEGAHLHDYHKEARPSRKIGHITLTDVQQPDPRVGLIKAALPEPMGL